MSVVRLSPPPLAVPPVLAVRVVLGDELSQLGWFFVHCAALPLGGGDARSAGSELSGCG